MKHSIVGALLFATLLLSLAKVASAQPLIAYCTNFNVAGEWAYVETGMAVVYDQTGKVLTTVPYASVGRYTLGIDGNLSGARTASSGGTILKATITGTATVNPDCTGTYTATFYDQSGNVTGSVVKFVVYVNNATEARMIVTSTPITPYPPNGTGSLGTVLTTEAKKLYPAY